ncbi:MULTISPECIES: GTP 3',8-cyclase MoaA [unclassified Fusibacter]|uniref:GTP 3',8-cyclase MoaA n=1 Tax=unclassified Fusibacter TaxID=2624464 RepID=UPI00101338EF|nr:MULTISPECIES: GTP 3',8-cyclase MoaA [unclassified Fusibacter]MCK8061129.1 GTP 3',8-cyclase MoaA [Fusibacter sp. A2]NPE23335.1 GTP 3',8-cyclase MoaA [Fusibacter sp. A1]RXV59378.1 GTP 3',8-cyclase MoaA [Fusibacter sp. A1]
MQDSFGRKMEYLRLSVTDRCNLRCQYCMPESGCEKRAHDSILRNEDFIKLVESMADMGVEKVRLTGGEPLVRKGLASMIKGIRDIKGIEEVTLTTNGLLLEDQLDDLKASGLSRLNISLDSLNPETYRRLTRGGDLASVLRGIDKALKLDLKPIKINVVLIKGENDHEFDDFLNAFDPSIEIRFIELMPIGEAASWNKEKFINLNTFISEREDLIPIAQHGNGGPCRYYKHLPTGRTVGMINPISDHFCDQCNRLRITSDGILKTCLHDRSEINLRPYLNQPEDLKQIILNAVAAKPESHQLNQTNSVPIRRNMYTIGG